MSESHYLETSKKVWERAAGFSPDKEQVYPDHARAQEFDQHRHELILEYGCGGGSDTISYLRRDNTVFACDIVPENIKVTSERVLERGFSPERFRTVLLPDSVPLPFDDNTFDVVSSHGVIHHIMDPGPVLAEFARVLRPDGHAYIMLYTEQMFQQYAQHVVFRMNHRKMSVWEAFGSLSDGEGVPYAKAYDLAHACYTLAEHFDVLGYREYLDQQFRTFKLAKLGPDTPPTRNVKNLDLP